MAPAVVATLSADSPASPLAKEVTAVAPVTVAGGDNQHAQAQQQAVDMNVSSDAMADADELANKVLVDMDAEEEAVGQDRRTVQQEQAVQKGSQSMLDQGE